jgi:hypothetical protein
LPQAGFQPEGLGALSPGQGGEAPVALGSASAIEPWFCSLKGCE